MDYYHDNKFSYQPGSYDWIIQDCHLVWNTSIGIVLRGSKLLQLPYMEMLSHVMSLVGRTKVNVLISINYDILL